MISIVSVTRRVEQENSIYCEGFAEGHRIGLRKGKALQRVDVAPGFDSIRANSQGILDSCGEGEQKGGDTHEEVTR